jgi:hypothetical protein
MAESLSPEKSLLAATPTDSSPPSTALAERALTTKRST